MISQTDKQTSDETSYTDGSRQHLLLISGAEATDKEYARVMTAQDSQWSEEEIQAAQEKNASRPFSIL